LGYARSFEKNKGGPKAALEMPGLEY